MNLYSGNQVFLTVFALTDDPRVSTERGRKRERKKIAMNPFLDLIKDCCSLNMQKAWL